jgi:hypothetical protein
MHHLDIIGRSIRKQFVVPGQRQDNCTGISPAPLRGMLLHCYAQLTRIRTSFQPAPTCRSLPHSSSTLSA